MKHKGGRQSRKEQFLAKARTNVSKGTLANKPGIVQGMTNGTESVKAHSERNGLRDGLETDFKALTCPGRHWSLSQRLTVSCLRLVTRRHTRQTFAKIHLHRTNSNYPMHTVNM